MIVPLLSLEEEGSSFLEASPAELPSSQLVFQVNQRPVNGLIGTSEVAHQTLLGFCRSVR